MGSRQKSERTQADCQIKEAFITSAYTTFGRMHWNDVIGQESLKKLLQHRIENDRIAHAQLFVGNHGYGTLPLALAYARGIITHEHQNPENAHLKLDKLVHPDVHFAYPVSTTPKVSSKPLSANFIEDWRKFVQLNPYGSSYDWMQHLGIEKKMGIINVHQSTEIVKSLTLKSFENGYKIMLIWMLDKMNASTANKLLKLLEEPPEKTVFIMVAESTDQLLSTILSRSQIIQVPPINRKTLAEELSKRKHISIEHATTLAQLSEGNYHEALHLLKAEKQEDFNQTQFMLWMRLCYTKKYFELLKWVDGIARLGRESQQNFLKYALHIFRESLMSNYGTPEMVHLTNSEHDFVAKFKPFINSANALELNSIFDEAIYHVERNVHPKAIFLDLSLQLMKLVRMKPKS